MSEGAREAVYRVTLRNRGGQEFFVSAAEPLLDALEEHGITLPYGCRYGGCMTCAGKLIAGEVDQSEGVALKDDQISAGYILLCVARPLSHCVLDIGVDSHDNLYRNPFRDPRPEIS